MIVLKQLRTLDLERASKQGRAAHLSAASGLVRAGSWFYVVADDEFSLGMFDAEGETPGRLISLLPGELPDELEARKAEKADFEALVRLPAFADYKAGALLALGSGSKKTRRRGVLLALTEDGAIEGEERSVDLAGLFAPLKERFDKPNIEGAFVSGHELCLLQRGNKGLRRNALLRYLLADFLAALAGGSIAEALAPATVHEFELGEIDGVQLGFTDGAALPDGRFVFSAVAENTDDAYEDGACVGAAIGIADLGGELVALGHVDEPHKIEGIEVAVIGTRMHLRLVTDGDDATAPAAVFATEITLPD